MLHDLVEEAVVRGDGVPFTLVIKRGTEPNR